MHGKVSIIMPAYNSEKFIGTAIQCVLEQTYSNWELIIVDDCSTDSTQEILKKWSASDSRIIFLKNDSNMGAAASRNKAIQAASGNFLAFLDSDDIWKRDKLERQLLFMANNDYSFTCTSYSKIDESGQELGITINALSVDYNGLLKRCPGNSTVIYDVKRLGKHIIPLIKKRNDYVMWLKVIKKSGQLYGMNEILSSHRIRKDSISSNKISLIKYHWIVYRKIEKISVLKSTYLVFFWIAKGLFKFQ